MRESEFTQPTTDPAKFSTIDRLKCFNAKERYWVVRQALGHFHPTDAFVRAAAKAAGVPPPIESAHSALYLAMDYHLNWLHAALTDHMPSIGPRGSDPIVNFPLTNGEKWAVECRQTGLTLVNEEESDDDEDLDEVADIGTDDISRRSLMENSQEDVDLLLAYLRPDEITQIILVEAKCTAGFTPKQIQSKAVRLSGILDGQNLLARKIDVKFVLMSPEGLQMSETLKRRIKIIRDHCGGEGRQIDAPGEEKYTNLVPNPSDTETGWGWMPLQIAPLDEERFWAVEFGTGKPNESTVKRIEAGSNGERWPWPQWYLRRRKRIVSRKMKKAKD